MSMLSSMCERLRQTADEVERIEGKNAVRLGLDAIALAYAVGELRDAADTIDGLRCRCQDVQAENARLRELVDALMGCGTRYHTMQGGCPMFDADAEDFCGVAQAARDLGIEVE